MNKYYGEVRRVTHRARNERLRSLGMSSSGVTMVSGGSSTTVVSTTTNTTTSGHTHANKSALDEIGTDAERYVWLTKATEVSDGTGTVTVNVSEKAKAGYADEAGKAGTTAEAEHALKADEATEAEHALKADEAGKAAWAAVADDLAVDSAANNRFLRKDMPDETEHLLKLLDGVEVGEYIRSMLAGKGAGIDSKGNAQVESLEVRSYLKVMELIFNRLTAMEGDYTFTESGTIETVEALDEERTYRVTLRKRWDNDFTALAEHDVVYGVVNDLLTGGEYKTCWLRVVSVDTTENTAVVVAYPDEETPAGVNAEPAAGMNVCRRGNALNEARQGCWYLSSEEGCLMYLAGVTKPILEESNYYLTLGRPKRLSAFEGMQLNYDHPYLFARGLIVQDMYRVDYQGQPVYEVVDKGLWDATTQYVKAYSAAEQRYVQHQVWWGNCCWRCVAEAATIGKAPRWNNTEWVCVVGDQDFSLEIESSAGHFFRIGKERTQLTATLWHGKIDVSEDATAVRWTRESGMDQEDALWNVEHTGLGLTLEVTPEDMATNWVTERKVTFRCTVSLDVTATASATWGIG